MLNPITVWFFLWLSICSAYIKSELSRNVREISTSSRSFIIDYEKNTFLKDGQPYRYIAGSIHYYRVPRDYWNDRLSKMKTAGLNAITTYVPWNVHETRPGQYYFSENANLTEFLTLAQDHGLDVILRMGPYTCGEFENGGLPWWLLKEVPDMKVRSKDTQWLYYVSKWYFKLFPMILPFLYKNGGPVITIQVENEYGSFYACDQDYTGYMRDLFRSYVGDDFVLFTTDGGALYYLKCGYTPGLYTTVDFGPGTRQDIGLSFAAQRAYAPNGPLVNSEFYPGWLDVWGQNHSVVDAQEVLDSMVYIYEYGASFNFYMFHGGTNFGYMNGAADTSPVTTSYDYDAPLSEAGDPTPKYFQIRDMITNLTGINNTTPLPKANPKRTYGKVEANLIGSIADLLHVWSDRKSTSTYPLTFEELDFPYGFVLYETIIPESIYGNLSIPGIRDRGYVMLDQRMQGVVSRFEIQKNFDVILNASQGQKLQILVENQGRRTRIPETRGIVQNVTLGDLVLIDWTMYPITIQDLFAPLKLDKPRRHLKNLIRSKRDYDQNENANNYVPSIYYAKFMIDQQPEDTFFNPDDWNKGQLFINDINVGRYWPAIGPQVTLYVPKTFLNQNLNYVLLFELEKPGNCRDGTMISCRFSLVDSPILNKTVYNGNDAADTEKSRSYFQSYI